jgi:hypothetical protein
MATASRGSTRSGRTRVLRGRFRKQPHVGELEEVGLGAAHDHDSAEVHDRSASSGFRGANGQDRRGSDPHASNLGARKWPPLLGGHLIISRADKI